MRIDKLKRSQWAIIGLVMIWIGLFPMVHAAPGKQLPYMFRHITTSDGLLNNNITALYRDSKGFLWVGTTAGLNRYDAYHFHSFFDNVNLRQNKHINNIFEDWDGHVWVEIQSGYAYFDYQTDHFHEGWKEFLMNLQITPDSIRKMGINNKHDILWAYDDTHLYIYNKRHNVTKKMRLADYGEISEIYVLGEFLYLICQSGRLEAINVNTLASIEHTIPESMLTDLSGHTPQLFVDRAGGIWVHSVQNSKLFYKRNTSTDWQEIHLLTDQNRFNRVKDMAEDEDGNIWVITSHLGVFILKPGSDDFTHLTNRTFHPQSIASDNLTSICTDQDGIIWLGTVKKGISYYSPLAQVFLSQRIIPNSDIISFYEDGDNVWLGTDGDGLLKLSESWERTLHTPIKNDVIQAIRSDAEGCLWMGTYQNGLIKYDQQKIENITTQNSELNSDIICDLFFDEQGYLWIATDNGCIQKYDTKKHTFTTVYQEDLTIHAMIYDGAHAIYAATSKGLLGLDMLTAKHRIILMENIPVVALFQDSKERVWMGNSEGLTYYNPKTKETGRLTMSEGLSSNSITAITEDNNQQLWVGTSNGLNRLKWIGNRCNIAHYYETDGVASNSINERALYKLRNGHLIVGTPHGFTMVIPQDVASNGYNKVVRLTDLYSPLATISEKLHKEALENIEEIFVPEGYTSVIARFSTLDFHSKSQISYYMSIGYGNENLWIKMNNNELQASWLPEGDYTVEVKARNANGDFTPNSKTYVVHVYPPFYRTKTAYLLYIVLILLTLGSIQIYTTYRRKKKLRQETFLKEREHQQKIMDMKLQFFANVSHELRTPLTLIINPLEEFLTKNPQYQNSLLSTVRQNSKYLTELINQLLDFRKLDVVGETISYVHCDAASLIRDQFHTFDNMAERNGIHFSFESSQASIMMDCDYDKLRKITLNLLSNAFKFTPTGGHISVGINTEERGTELWMKLYVKDDGCGISPQEKEHLFECFYQAESQDHSQGGSGIGLYLVKQYVDLHKGEISITDNTPQGTVFTVALPMRAPLGQVVPTHQPAEQQQAETEKQQSNYTILVVDDNIDFLNFLAASLSTQYHVLKATNGHEALEISAQENVDLVISDVMMPVMDGLQLCKTIKSDIKSSHIPVILLTARTSDEHQLEGLSYGADDYITKPFSMEILQIRVRNMLESRLKRQEQFDREVKIEPNKIAITPLDQQFIQKAIQVVEDNLEDSEFTVEMLAEQLNTSRTQLYRKLAKLTGKNPLDFIRAIRLKRAQQLLQESQMQVSEIAYKIGYNSPKLFTKHFKEAFGMPPSEYAAMSKS